MASKRDTTTRGGVAGRRSPGVTVWYLPFVIGLLLAAYLALFYSVPLPQPFERMTRMGWLWLCALRPDDLAAGWFGDPPQFVLVDRFALLLTAAGILGCAGLLGRLVLSGVRADRGLTRLESIVFSFGVGLNAVSLYVLCVGLAGGLQQRWLFVGPAIAVVVVAVTRWRTEIADCGWRMADWKKSLFSREPTASANGTDNGDAYVLCVSPRWLWLAAPFVLIILLAAMLPPVDFDVREYHLQAPKEFYLQGRITFLPHNVYANMPLGSEMLSLLAMVVMGDWWFGALAGKTVIAAAAGLTAIAIYAAGRRFFSTAAGVVGALVYISIPWIAQVSSGGLVEGMSALYMFLAVYAVLLWREADAADRTVRLALAGFMAGAAAACKYPGALFVLLPLAAYIVARLLGERALWHKGSRTNDVSNRMARPEEQSAWRHTIYHALRSWGRVTIPISVFLLAASVACGGWFAKNWILTGNPTYPLLYRVFDGATRSDAKNAQWVRAHRTPDYSLDNLASTAADVLWRSPWLSPLVVPLAALAAADRRNRRLVPLLAGYVGFVIAAWCLFTHRIDRFWIPALSVASLLCGVGAVQLARLATRWMLCVLLAAGLTANLLFIVAGAGGWNAYFVNLARLRVDPQRIDPWHLYLNDHVPAGGAVLAVGDAQVFDLEAPVYYSTVFDDCLFEQLMRGGTAQQRLAALSDRGITHVYVHWGEIGRYRSPGNYGFTDFVQPKLLDELVAQRVLKPPLPMIEGHTGQVFAVDGRQ